MMKNNQSSDYYRARIEAVEDYSFMVDRPDWKVMLTILGLSVPCKKEIETPDFMKEDGYVG